MRAISSFVFLVLTLTLLPCSQAEEIPYYGGLDFVSSKDLQERLHTVMHGSHYPQTDSVDIIEDERCFSSDCYAHDPMSYKNARRKLFGDLYLDQDKDDNYSLLTSYCLETFTNDRLPTSARLGPNRIPSSRIINTEHSWPQSKFNSRFSKGMQKSDLHALLPVKSRVNSMRGNRPFGVVVKKTDHPCANAKFGKDAKGHTVFEPSDESKGNVARALFYFAVKYKLRIDGKQERWLREWHEMDPPDALEVDRNNRIFLIQFTRNPFIDHPELVELIHDF